MSGRPSPGRRPIRPRAPQLALLRPLLLPPLLALGFLPGALVAQDADPDPDPEADERPDRPLPMDTIFVQGRQAELAASVMITDFDEAEHRHATLAYDALDARPGLHVPRRMGFSGTGLTRLAIRGAGTSGPAGLPTFLDGRADPAVSFAHPIPQSHIAEDIQQVEIIRGPSPVLHGSGNTGVMNVRTRRPPEGWSGRVRGSGGSFGTFESHAGGAYGWRDGHLRVSGTYRETDGHLDGPEGSTDARIRSARMEASQALGEGWRARVSAGMTRDRFGVYGPFHVPGPFGAPGTTELALIHTFGDVDVEGWLGNALVSLQVGGNDLDPRSQVVREGPDGPEERADVRDGTARLSVTLAPWGLDRLVAGVDALRATARNTPAGPEEPPEMDVSLTEVGPYLFAEHRVSPRVKLSGGIRVTEHSEYGTEPSGEAGMVVRPAGDAAAPGGADFLEGTTLRARATRGFQSPTLQQLFGVFLGGPGGPANPELDPERVRQFEVGVHHEAGRFTIDLVGFQQRGRDLIAPLEGRLRNIGAFRHRGLEAEVRGGLGNELMLHLGATLYDLSEEALRVPRRTVDGGLTWVPSVFRPDDLSVAVLARHARGIRDEPPAPGDAPDGASLVRLDDHHTVRLRFGYRFRDGVEAFARLDNVTDQEYETIAGIPMPGRSLQAGVALSF